jgi:hypothetical protein
MDTDDYEYIYRPAIRTRNGKTIYAVNYGLKAFRIRVRRKAPPDQPKLPGIE